MNWLDLLLVTFHRESPEELHSPTQAEEGSGPDSSFGLNWISFTIHSNSSETLSKYVLLESTLTTERGRETNNLHVQKFFRFSWCICGPMKQWHLSLKACAHQHKYLAHKLGILAQKTLQTGWMKIQNHTRPLIEKQKCSICPSTQNDAQVSISDTCLSWRKKEVKHWFSDFFIKQYQIREYRAGSRFFLCYSV